MASQSGNVVIGYDGSEQSVAALDWATAAARQRGRPLTVLHVVDYFGVSPGTEAVSPWLPELAERSAQEITAHGAERARTASPGLDITAVTHVGRVSAALLEASHDADLLVVGTRGRGDLTGMVLGSTAFAVSSRSWCPVVVVRGDSAARPGPQHPVVLGVDPIAPAPAALDHASDEADRWGAPLVVLSAYTTIASTSRGAIRAVLDYTDGPAYDRQSRQAADDAVQLVADEVRARHPGLEVRTSAVVGAPVPALVAAASGCGLVVLGTHGHGTLGSLVLGSVGHGMIHTSPCPVAIVRRSAGVAGAPETVETSEVGAGAAG